MAGETSMFGSTDGGSGWNWDSYNANGGGMFSFLQDPNVRQYMGQVGSGLSSGQPIGTVLDPSRMIARAQLQRALGGTPSPMADTAVPTASPQGGKVSDLSKMDFGWLNPTPIGQPGPDSVTMTKTADGTKISTSIPSDRNLNTYGTSVPPESIPASQNGGVSDQRPFWRALLG